MAARRPVKKQKGKARPASARGGSASLSDALATIKKNYGRDFVGQASSARAFRAYPRLRLGIFAVDYLTGGGFPISCGTLLWGEEAGGKSYLCLRAVAAAQRMCRKCVQEMKPTGETWFRCFGCGSLGPEETCQNTDQEAPCRGASRAGKEPALACPACSKYEPMKSIYADSDKGYTTEWAARHGVDSTLVYVIQARTAEQYADIAMELLRTGEIGLVILDSIAQLAPKTEMEETMEKQQQGLLARIVNKLLRQFVAQSQGGGLEMRDRTTFVFVNQVRNKIGVMFGSPDVKPGGLGQNFASAVILKVKTKEREKDGAGNLLSSIINVQVDKSKVSTTAGTHGNFRLWFRDCTVDDEPKWVGCTDEEHVLVEYGLLHGAIKREGSKYAVLDRTVTSQDALRALLRDDREAREHVRSALLATPLGEVWYSIAAREKAREAARQR